MIRESKSDTNLIPAPKRRKYRNYDVKPFPTDCNLTGIFTGLEIEIFDVKSIKILSQAGCFGNNSLNYRHRPMAVLNDEERLPVMSQNEYERKLHWKDKFGIKDSDAQRMVLVDEDILPDPFIIKHSHVLIPEEAMFLHMELKCLEIKNLDGNVMKTEEIWKEFCDLKHNFVECYVGYLYLKSKNWIVKSGIKFGGHFLLYKQGPQYYHASFIVKIVTSYRSCYEHQTNERIAEVTKKTMLYLEIFHPEDVDSSKYLENLDKFKVKEVVVRRYDVKEKFMG